MSLYCLRAPVRNIRCRCLVNLAWRFTRQSRSGARRDGVSHSWYDRISTICFFSYSLRISYSFKASALSLETKQKQVFYSASNHEGNNFTQFLLSVSPLGKNTSFLEFKGLRVKPAVLSEFLVWFEVHPPSPGALRRVELLNVLKDILKFL